MIYVLWLIFAILVGLLGQNRKIGFGMAFFWSILLSPLIGIMIVLISDKNNANKTTPKYKHYWELGDKAEFKGQFKEALDYYMDSLFHLENDFKNKKLSNHLEGKRQKYILEIKDKMEKIKTENPDLSKI